jgi:hypothetical protein
MREISRQSTIVFNRPLARDVLSLSRQEEIANKPEVRHRLPLDRAEQSQGDRLTAHRRRLLLAPPTREQRDRRGVQGRIGAIKGELGSIKPPLPPEKLEPEKPDGGVLFKIGTLKKLELNDQRLARNYKTVRTALLPLDRKGSVSIVGGVCAEALREIEQAAGDPAEWKKEDLQNPAVNELIASYQALNDLRDNRILHAPQVQALERLAEKQQRINSEKAQNHAALDDKQRKNIENVIKALTDGIGIATDGPWAKASQMGKPENVLTFLNYYKSSIALPNGAETKIMIDRPGSDKRQKSEKDNQPSLIEILLSILVDAMKDIFPKLRFNTQE